MRRIFCALTIMMTALVITTLGSTAARACQCAEVTEEGSLEIINNAALIFEGIIMDMNKAEEPEENFDYTIARPVTENPLFAKLRLKVLDVYKGTPQGRRIEAYSDVTTSCGYLYRSGDYVTFILNRDGENLVQADICHDPLPAHWQQLKDGAFND